MPAHDPSTQLDRIASLLASVHEPAGGRRPGARDDTTATIQHAIAPLPLPTLVADDQGRYVAASDSACALTGYACEELLGRYVWDLTAGATRGEFEPLWRAFLSQGRQRGTYMIQPRSGAPFAVDYVAQAHVRAAFTPACSCRARRAAARRYSESVMLKTVFLDAGGVLLFPNWSRVEDALARQGVTVPASALSIAEPRARKQLDDRRTIGTTTDASRGWLFFDLILEEAGIARSPRTAAALAELHAYHQANNLWELVPDGVVPALTALRARGLTLVVVSNANGTLRAHMERIGLRAHVDVVIDSCEEGVEKPDPRLFEIALARVGAAAAATIHVGDIYQVDVVGARAAGVRPVLLDETGLHDGVDCVRVRSLAELVDRISGGEFDSRDAR